VLPDETATPVNIGVAVFQLGIRGRVKEKNMASDKNSIIALDKFIRSTRDSGYKSTASAVAELVDNALQASARSVDIRVEGDPDGGATPTRVIVADDGHGMDDETLRQALRFGGSSRYDDRGGLGRFGMGLPNASLSQAKRVDVYSWQRRGQVRMSYLDVDDVVEGRLSEVPAPNNADLPDGVKNAAKSGTVVVWQKCDRLDHRRISTTVRKLTEHLGRMFRYFIWDAIRITINGKLVPALDPLFLRGDAAGATTFQEPTKLEVYANPDKPTGAVGTVTITFTELPVLEWQHHSNEDKRRLGISNGAGVSIVRGGREVDFGWYFMGGKRRENYDDWWRCEVRFDPVLDEAFGITHTKQRVRPADHLLEALQPHVETLAKALNSRVRQAHLHAKTGKVTATAEAVAERHDSNLKPIPKQSILALDTKALRDLSKRNTVVRATQKERVNGAVHYRLVEDAARGPDFFCPVVGDGMVLGTLNPKHRFYVELYQPLLEARTPEIERIAKALQLTLLAAARAEAMMTRRDEQAAVARFRREWSDVLDVMLKSPR